MDKEQKLIDLCFEIGIALRFNPAFQEKNSTEIGTWIAKQLRANGFNTSPSGMSWGVKCETDQTT